MPDTTADSDTAQSKPSGSARRQRPWLAAATDRALLGRSLVTCLLVGALLTAINQGDRLVRGEFSGSMAWQIGLTFLVPFVVATMSGAAALRGHVHEGRDGQARMAEGMGGAPDPDKPAAASDGGEGQR
jgi:hypothetical protein